MTRSTGGELSPNRRRVLQLMAALSAVAVTAGPAMAGIMKKQQGYGQNVDTTNPQVTWDKSLEEDQLKALTILGDIIIPADEKSPAASAVDIADFIDEWVSAPYPKQQRDRETILGGLKWLDMQASDQSQHSTFMELYHPQQVAIFDRLAKSVQGGSAEEAQETFFERLVFLVAGGFYTTPEGNEDIGFVGNVALEEFTGPPPEVRKILGL